MAPPTPRAWTISSGIRTLPSSEGTKTRSATTFEKSPGAVSAIPVGVSEFAAVDGGRAFVALDGTSLNVQLSSDFATYAWRKLLLNVVVNPITALTLQRQSVLRRADVHALCLEVLAEAIAVGKADGARVKEEDAASIMATLFSYSGELGTSMYFDRLAGRPLEIEALTGAVVAAGERHGVPTPLNRAFLALLHAVSDGAAGGS